MNKAILPFCIGVSLLLLNLNSSAQAIINSFETAEELKSIQATAGVAFSQSTDFPALNEHSLSCRFPAAGGELRLNDLNASNWNEDPAVQEARANALLLFAWTNTAVAIELLVEDSLGKHSGKNFTLHPGANHLQVSFAELKDFNMAKVKSLVIKTAFTAQLYLDYIALDQYQKVFDKKGRWDVDYSGKIVTPHFPWASHFASGKIKTYSISPIFDGRGIIELSERLALDYTTTTIGRNAGINRWGFGDFYHRRNPMGDDGTRPYSLAFNYIAEDLLFNPEYDVIIWPGLHPWGSYPLPLREALLARIAKGTGLLLLYPDSKTGDSSGFEKFSPLTLLPSSGIDSLTMLNKKNGNLWPFTDTSAWAKTGNHYITRGVELKAFPMGQMGIARCINRGEVLITTSEGNPVVSVGTYGKGRIVAMSYTENGFIPKLKNPWETGLSYPFWEDMWSLVARSVVWAAKKEPLSEIVNVTASTGYLQASFNNIHKGDSIRVRIGDDFGVVEEEFSLPLNANNKGVVKIPFTGALHGGDHFATLQVTGPEGVYDWYSLKFSTTQKGKIDLITTALDEIPIGRSVVVSAALSAENSFEGELTAALYDNYNRLVDIQTQHTVFSGKKNYQFTLVSKNILSHLGRVEFLLSGNQKQCDRKMKEIFFHQPRKWDDYDVTMYHFGPNPVPGTWSAIDAQLQKMQVTTLAAYTMEQSKHANYKVQAQTRISGMESPDSGPDLAYYDSIKAAYLKTHNKRVLVRKYGLNDSVFLHAVRDELRLMVPAWRKFSPSAYYIYEEPSVTRYDDALDLDFSDLSLKAMRQWLKQKYPSLNALNEQWGSKFNNWNEVIPDDSREAQQSGNYSSWADHRSFMEKTWADQFRYVQNVLHEIDPGGLVQLSGTQAAGAHNGYDYSQLDKHVGQMNPYDIGNQLEYHHDFNPALKISGQAGYGASGKEVLSDFYQHVFVNETGGAYIFWQQSALNPDLTFCASGLDMKNGFHEMREKGIGKLIASFQPENENKIAIHYSYPSIHASWIVDGKILPGRTYGNSSATLEQFRRNLDGWVKTLKDAGLGFNFIAYSGIEDGELLTKGFKTLILPMSLALSDNEVKQITAFVSNGGIVITDALAGVMDGHTKFRPKQALADVFGIQAMNYGRNDLITPASERKLKMKDAKSLSSENMPQLLEHTFGKGKAFLLNYFLEKYPADKIANTHEPLLAKTKRIFQQAGLASSIHFFGTDNKPVTGIAKYSFADEKSDIRLLGVLPDKSTAGQEVSIHFNKKGHLYDVRNSKYVGSGEVFSVKIEPSVPGLYALLPGTINGVKAQTTAKARRGEAVQISFQVETENNFAVHSVASVYVYNPAGEKITVYSDNVTIENNEGIYTFHTALNDAKGQWKMVIMETISGKQTELAVILE